MNACQATSTPGGGDTKSFDSATTSRKTSSSAHSAAAVSRSTPASRWMRSTTALFQ
jgi:hypothetical protein